MDTSIPTGSKSSPRGTVNIQAVAEAAGVSKTTVSHVLSGKRPVSEATRQKVEKVMDELGFTPNFFAQALNSRRSQTVALVVQDITNPFYPSLARGLQQAMADSGQIVTLFDGYGGPEQIREFLRGSIQRQVDGVVMAIGDCGEELLKLRNSNTPVVLVGPNESDLEIDSVSADDHRIGHDTTTHLAKLGHHRIALISGPEGGEPAVSRLAGYASAVREFGLATDTELVMTSDWTREGGNAAMTDLLALPEPPSAVLCANDLMAIGALDAAITAGLSVPNDLALIGVDDIDAAALARPTLSTVRIPAEEIGRVAGELLLGRIDRGYTSPVQRVAVQHTLIARQTTEDLHHA